MRAATKRARTARVMTAVTRVWGEHGDEDEEEVGKGDGEGDKEGEGDGDGGNSDGTKGDGRPRGWRTTKGQRHDKDYADDDDDQDDNDC